MNTSTTENILNKNKRDKETKPECIKIIIEEPFFALNLPLSLSLTPKERVGSDRIRASGSGTPKRATRRFVTNLLNRF